MSDPRREPDDEATATTTGRRRVVERLEREAPLPSLPPESERASNPNLIMQFMLDIATSQRAYATAALEETERTRESIAALTREVDDLKGSVVAVEGRLDKRLGRLEERVGTVVNAQIVQGSQIAEVKKDLGKMQVTFEGALTNFDGRVSRVEKRVDGLERDFQQFRELIMADVAVRRKQVAIEEAKNGGPPTPRAKDDPSDPTPEGSD